MSTSFPSKEVKIKLKLYKSYDTNARNSFLVTLLGFIGLSHDDIYTQKYFQINCDLLLSFVRAV